VRRLHGRYLDFYGPIRNATLNARIAP
jgi:hypothetical protein